VLPARRSISVCTDVRALGCAVMRTRLLLAPILLTAFVGCSDTESSVTPGVDTGVVDTAVADTGVADTGATVDSTTTDTAADTAVVDSGASDTSGDAGAGKKTVWVARIGDGTAIAADAAGALFLDPIEISYSGTTATGTVGTAVAIPATGAGAITLPISNSVGSLSRSTDGKLVSFMAYKAAPGTAALANAAPATVKRVAVSVNATGTVSSMELGAEAAGSGASLRGAVTVDGSAFWTSSGEGIAYTATAGTTTKIATGNTRWPFAFGGQLYVTSGSGTPGRGVLSVGTGMPTATATLTVLPGTSSGSSASPYGVLALDTDSTAGVDTLYVCDDQATGGVQKFKLESATWVLKTTHTGGFAGCRGVTGWVDGTNVYLVAVTIETSPRAVLMVDTVAGTTALTTSTELAKAATNAQYRGVAIAPAP